MHWFALQANLTYEASEDAVEEFLDERFQRDWLGIEQSCFLVWAADAESAEASLREEEQAEYVNIYGQRIRKRVGQVLGTPNPIEGLPPAQDETVLEISSELWSVPRDTDWRSQLADWRRTGDRTCPMIDPIDFYEHRERYEALRGPLPHP